MLIKVMSDLKPFEVEGPVKFFKVLTLQEKQLLVDHKIIQEKELNARIMSFYDSNKRVIGYDIQSD
jgi:hypothetical protein